MHLVNRKPLFIFPAFQTLSSSSANPVSDPPLPSPVTSAARIYDFLQEVAARSKEGKTDPKHTDKGDGREREREEGREGGGGQTDKSGSSSSALARNVKQFS